MIELWNPIYLIKIISTYANIITGKSILGVSGSAVVPSGSLTITTNTTTDVTNYASVVTNIPEGGDYNIVSTDNHDGSQSLSVTDAAGVGATCLLTFNGAGATKPLMYAVVDYDGNFAANYVADSTSVTIANKSMILASNNNSIPPVGVNATVKGRGCYINNIEFYGFYVNGSTASITFTEPS